MNLYRTFLFAPGSESRKAEKALVCGADVIIWDLEDAVAVSEKAKAREVVAAVLQQPRSSLGYVRVNSLGSGLAFEDLETVVCGGLDGIVLPKSETESEIKQVDGLIGALEEKRGLEIKRIEIMPLIETAVGLYNVVEIMRSSGRVNRVAFGSGDFTLDIGSEWTKEGEEVAYARSRLVVASRVAGIEQPIDAVFADVRDLEGLRADARLGRKMGFQGKLVIHPSQVEPANEIYSPTSREVEWSHKVMNAFQEAESRGIAAIQVEGKLVDYPVAEKARRVLAKAEVISARRLGDSQAKC